MQILKVPRMALQGDVSLPKISAVLDKLDTIPIDCNPWPEFGHNVAAGFSIAHNSEAILLKYYVEENFLLAAASSNGEIHKDSCVEFFVDLDDSGNYYNLEFNCIGWYKIGYGTDRINRQALPTAVTDGIVTSTTIHADVVDGKRRFQWELTVIIPSVLFCFHEITTLNAMRVRGNFHKCGDELPTPHFLTWNDVSADLPDFHRREDFADILFL